MDSILLCLECLLDFAEERGQSIDLVVATLDGTGLEVHAVLVDLGLWRVWRYFILNLILARQHATV